MIKNKYFTDTRQISVYVLMRKDTSEISNEEWAVKYKGFKNDQLDKRNKIFNGSNDIRIVDRDSDIFELLNNPLNFIDYPLCDIQEISLSDDEIKNGFGTIDVKNVFNDFYIENGNGIYLAQLFMKNHTTDTYSLLSEIIKIEINDMPIPSVEPSPSPMTLYIY